jgi:hypothetical protein
MSTATTDPTLEALVPRGSAARNVVLVLLALALLAAVWLLPPVLRPAVVTTSYGGGSVFPAESREVTLTTLEPRGWGGVTVRGVDDVPGAHVVWAWVLEGDHVEGAVTTLAGLGAADWVAQVIGAGDQDRLPRTVAAGRPATLVVLWQVDDCATVATGSGGTDVHVTGRWGTSRVEQVMAGPIRAPGPAGDVTACLG